MEDRHEVVAVAINDASVACALQISEKVFGCFVVALSIIGHEVGELADGI